MPNRGEKLLWRACERKSKITANPAHQWERRSHPPLEYSSNRVWFSEAGKTTISRLAPRDVTLLTDEISYGRRSDEGYVAFGTPFTGELAKLGENVSAPVAALYLLAKGSGNRIEPIAPGEAARSLLRNLLFLPKMRNQCRRLLMLLLSL